MHTYNSEKETRFHYDLDFSGDIIIFRNGKEIRVPASDILEFITQEYVIPRIEQDAVKTFLGRIEK